MTVALMELKVKVRVSVQNVVGGTSILNQGHFSSAANPSHLRLVINLLTLEGYKAELMVQSTQ